MANSAVGSPLFAMYMGDGQEHKPGNVTVRDWRYWILWIGLYSSARLGEIAQLSTVDIRQLHGAWVMHITKEGSPLKSTKDERARLDMSIAAG